MNKTPLLITVSLMAIAALAGFYINCSNTLDITDADRVNFYIAIAACLGAFVSATFVIFSYLQTNRAYIESQRPHLLIQLESLFSSSRQDDQGKPIPLSRLHYRNITNNRFSDLTIDLQVLASNRKISVNELFRSRMTMIGQDSRQRTFEPEKELLERGINLQEIASSGNEVILNVGYSYTFNGVLDNVDAQSYRWNAKERKWQIR